MPTNSSLTGLSSTIRPAQAWDRGPIPSPCWCCVEALITWRPTASANQRLRPARERQTSRSSITPEHITSLIGRNCRPRWNIHSAQWVTISKQPLPRGRRLNGSSSQRGERPEINPLCTNVFMTNVFMLLWP